MHTHRRWFVALALLLAGFVVSTSPGELLSIPSALAQTTNNVPPSWNDTMNSLLTKAAHALLFVNVLGFIALELVEYFLRPDIFSGAGIASGGALRNLWMMSRDIMNILFAVMLIGVAFYTITTGKSEKIKEHIVHFILAVILVNFSWFFPRVIIDIAHVTTATVFSIPNVVMSQTNTECKTFDQSDCVILTAVKVFPSSAEVNTCEPLGREMAQVAQNGAGSNCQCLRGRDDTEAPVCWWLSSYDSAESDAYSIVNALAVNYGRLTGLSQVAKFNPPDNVGDAPQPKFETSFFLNLFFSLFFGIAMVFPFVGLAIGLLIRVIVLWATIAFMPFAFLGFAVKGKLGTDVFGMEDYIWKEFLIAAFLPVLVAVPISIGFVMIMAGVQVQPTSQPGIEFGIPLVSGIDGWWELFWGIAAVMILWTGAFAALKKSKYIAPVVSKIESFGRSVGSVAAKVPLMTPIPTPGGGMMRAGQVVGGVAAASNIMDRMAFRGESLGTAFNNTLGGRARPAEVERARTYFQKPEARTDKDAIKAAVRELTNAGTNLAERNKALEKIRFLLSNERKGGMDARTLTEEADVVSALRSMQSDLELGDGELNSLNAMASPTTMNITASTGNPQTNITVNGRNVDMSRLMSGDQTQITATFRELGIDPQKLNTRAGYQDAINALNAANNSLTSPELKTKTATMATKLGEMMEREGNTMSVEEAFTTAASSA